MRALVHTTILAAIATSSLALATGGAWAAERSQPKAAAPSWMESKQVRKRIRASGEKGVRIGTIRRWVRNGLAGPRAQQDDPPMMPCPTVDPSTADVYSGQCVVFPAGCTANFIFKTGAAPLPPASDGRTAFIGTAGHCVDHSNQTVFMQRGPTIIAVGVVTKHIDGGIGNDFAAIRINEGLTIDPHNPAGGPQGIYTGCEPQGVKYYGHGFGVFVGQGKIEGGVATNWFDRAFAWTGAGLPGDSGSGVTIAGTDAAAGDLTHLVVDPRYPGSTLAGTRVTRILGYLGGNYYLVNQDRTTARATMADTDCGNASNGNGGPALPGLPALPLA
jgi:hypothetical protein